MSTALVSQSDYIPWRGYFDLIASADTFVILDDVQYTRRDWRNRNKIKTANGLQWITIPVESKGKYDQRVCETTVTEGGWAPTHWKTLMHTYGKAPCFKEVAAWLAPLYEHAAALSHLSQINRLFIQEICNFLAIPTRLCWSTDFFPLETLDAFDKNRRLIELCKAAGADHYISGPSAGAYMDAAQFASDGIGITFADYREYPPYPQLYGEFTPYVSILDTLFSLGKKAREVTVGFAIKA